MKQKLQNDMKHVNVNVGQMPLFAITNNVGIEINADMNLRN